MASRIFFSSTLPVNTEKEGDKPKATFTPVYSGEEFPVFLGSLSWAPKAAEAKTKEGRSPSCAHEG